MRAVVELLEHGTFERLTMPAIAEAAAISLRTLYRYYPDREALSLALGRWVDERLLHTGLPRTAEEIAAQMEEIGPRFEEHLPLVRALVGAPTGAERSPRRAERLATLETVVADRVAELPRREARRVVALVQLLASAPAWLQLRDESGVPGREAGNALGWAIRLLLDVTDHTPKRVQGGKNDG